MKNAALLALTIFLLSSTCALSQTSGTDAGQSAASAKPAMGALTNDDVLRLSQGGLGDDVIIAKINSTPQATFRLETDDLINLKKAGVSQAVIAAMLKRSEVTGATAATVPSSNSTPAAAPANASMFMPGTDDVLIRLTAKDGTTDLTSIAGHMASTWAYITVLVFTDFPGTKATVRTKDQRPYIIVQTRRSPQGRFFLVRCESNEKDGSRSVKQGRHGLFTNKDFGAPDTDWTVPFDVKQVQPGLWRMDPRQDMKPGEYGVYGGWMAGPDLYDFGIDS